MRRPHLEALLILLAALLAVSYVVLPAGMAAMDKGRSIYRQSQNAKLVKTITLDQVLRDNAKLKEKVEKVNAYLKLGKERSRVLEMMQQALKQAGLNQAAIQAEPEQGERQNLELGYGIKCRGNFHQIMKFTSMLEKSGLVSSVEQLSMVSTPRNPEGIRAELRVVFFAKGDKFAAGN